MENKTYSNMYATLRKQGISARKAKSIVKGYAQSDLYQYGTRKWFKASGQHAAATKWSK